MYQNILLANKKIVITGGPSTGKTKIIEHLEHRGETCLHEISRQVTMKAQQQGISQLFLEDPILFSQKLIEGRIQQFTEAVQLAQSRIFLDRGIPDVIAYMDFAGESYPVEFINACKTYWYDYIFILPPWEDIHVNDNERYESFDQAIQIHSHLHKTYSNLGYQCIEVPYGTIEERGDFILQKFPQML